MRALLFISLVVIGLSSSLALTGCGTNEAAQAEPSGSTPIVLPSPPPMPTSPPMPPTPTAPPAPAQAAPAGTTLLSADFNPGASLAQWTVIDTAAGLSGPSIWQVHDGHLSPMSDAGELPGQYGTAIVTGDASWRDYSATVAAYNIDNDTFGVVARASDRGFYAFNLVPSSTKTIAILTRYDAPGGSFKALGQVEIGGITPRQWTTLRLLVHGDQLSGFVGGQPVLQVSDTTLAQGRTGVYGYAMGGLEFDNFNVQTPAGL